MTKYYYYRKLDLGIRAWISLGLEESNLNLPLDRNIATSLDRNIDNRFPVESDDMERIPIEENKKIKFVDDFFAITIRSKSAEKIRVDIEYYFDKKVNMDEKNFKKMKTPKRWGEKYYFGYESLNDYPLRRYVSINNIFRTPPETTEMLIVIHPKIEMYKLGHPSYFGELKLKTVKKKVRIVKNQFNQNPL